MSAKKVTKWKVEDEWFIVQQFDASELGWFDLTGFWSDLKEARNHMSMTVCLGHRIRIIKRRLLITVIADKKFK